jgi:hypothetical protein
MLHRDFAQYVVRDATLREVLFRFRAWVHELYGNNRSTVYPPYYTELNVIIKLFHEHDNAQLAVSLPSLALLFISNISFIGNFFRFY